MITDDYSTYSIFTNFFFLISQNALAPHCPLYTRHTMSDLSKEVRECFAMMKGKTGEVSWDDMFVLLQKISSVHKVTKSQLTEWWGGEEIGIDKFAYILEQARVECNQGTLDQQAEKLRKVFIAEIFVILDTNKDGKVSKQELADLMPSVQTPKPITEAEITELLKIADLKPLMSKSQFGELFQDYLLEERKDIPLPLFLRAAQNQQEMRQMTKAKTSTKLMDRVRAYSKKTPLEKQKSTSPRTPAPSSPFNVSRSNVSFGSPDVRASITSQSLENHSMGGGLELYATESADPMSPQSVPTPSASRKKGGVFSLRNKEKEEVRHEKEVNFQLQNELKFKNQEVARLQEIIRERDGQIRVLKSETESSPTSPLSNDDQVAVIRKLEESDQQVERLVDALDTARDELGSAQEQNARLAEENQRLLNQLTAVLKEQEDFGEQRIVLQRQLQGEKDKTRDLAALRRKETTDETKRRADFSKAKSEIKLKAEELSEAKDLIEKYEMEIAMMRLNARQTEAESSRRASSQWDSDDSDAEESRVVFLNPPHQTASSSAVHSTLFAEPESIYYEFPDSSRPTQMLFELMVTNDSVTEYIVCRDASRKRSLSMTVQGGELLVPLVDGVKLPLGEWASVSVTFHWQRHHYSLFVGTQRVCTEHPFRDSGVSGMQSFDAYPRVDSSVMYANIRFVDC